jgi:hypothetical protein
VHLAIGGHYDVQPVKNRAEEADAGNKAAAERPFPHDQEERHESEPGYARQIRPGEGKSQKEAGEKAQGSDTIR